MAYFIKQMGDKDCAMTCLKMLFAITYKNEDYLYYPEPFIDKSMNLREIMQEGLKEGVRLSAYNIQNKAELFKERINSPILVTVIDDNLYHMVLIKTIHKKRLQIYDPKRGIRWVKDKDFLKVWTGLMIEVISADETKKQYHINKLDVVPRQRIAITLIFQFLSLVSLLLTMFFIDKSFDFIIPIVLFIAYILFEFIYQKMIIYSLKKFDNTILINDYSFQKEKFREYYEPMSKFKVILISEPIKLMASIMTIIFGVFILGINNTFNLLILVILFIIQILFKSLDKKYFESERSDLELLEKDLFVKPNLETIDFQNNVRNLNKKTYKMVSYINLKRYVMFFITLGLCLSYQALTGFISIDFMLFHLFLYVYLEENFDKILDASELRHKYRYYKCLYLHYFR